MKNKNAYFTVEATLVFPFALIVTLVMVYLWLYQYDRCILEQDTGRVALWGAVEPEQNKETMEQRIADRLAETDEEIYIGWKSTERKATLNKNVFQATSRGMLRVPFITFSGENLWEAKGSYSFERMDEVGLVRLCNRLVREQSAQQKNNNN